MTSPEQKKFLEKYNKYNRKVKIGKISILILLTFLWQLSSSIGLIDEFFFSSPYNVIKTFFEMVLSGKIFPHLFTTLIETIIAFFISTLIGIGIGVLLWWNNYLREIFDPYVILLNSLPKTALAPIIIVWFGNNYKSIIITAVSIGIFATIITFLSAINKVDSDKIKLVKILGGNKKDVLFKVVLPSSIEIIISICKVNIGLSLIGVIIGEFLVAQKGLGYLIMYGSQTFKIDWVIMSITLLAIISYLFYILISKIENIYDINKM